MRKRSWLKLLLRFFGFKQPLVLATLFLFSGLSVYAQVAFFSRYFDDQPRRGVVVQDPQILGTLIDGKVHLSEGQAIEMALLYNLDINVQRYVPLSNRWLIEENQGIYDPDLQFGFNWDRETRPTTNTLQGGQSVTDVITDVKIAYRQKFSTGASVEAMFEGVRNRTTSFFSSFVPAINSRFEILYRQNLLEGFPRIGPDYEIEISRNNLDISNQDFKRQVTEIVLQVQDRYWELQFALRDIQSKEKSLELATTVLENNRVRLEAGAAARLDVIEAQAEVAMRQEELIRAQFYYREVQDDLVKLMTNFEDPREFPGEIVPSDGLFTHPPVEEAFDRLQTMSRELRPELQQADLHIENQRLSLDRTRNELRPTLDLIAGYQQFGLGGNRIVRDFSVGIIDPRIVDVIQGGLGDSLDRLFSTDFYGYVLGVDLTLPLSNTEDRARNARAQIGLDQAELRKRNVEQAVSLEIRKALNQIEMNQASLQAGEAAVRSSGERLAGEQERFNVGMSTTRQLIEAQRDELQSESILLRAQVDLVKGHHLLDKAVGRTLDRHNIRLSDALVTNIK